jgi:hypothetical protein
VAQMPILSGGELRVVEVTDPSEQSLVGSYWSAGFDGFLETGDVGRLAPFVGVTAAGLPLETDPDVIEGFYFDHGPVDVREYYKQ